MKKKDKFDNLMSDVTHGKLKENGGELISRMEEVLEEEEMGTLDDMMNDIRNYLDSKNKLDSYLNENGVMQVPLETVFSWFSTSIKKRKQAENQNK